MLAYLLKIIDHVLITLKYYTLGAKQDTLDKYRILGRRLEKPTWVLVQANRGNRFEW